MGDTCVFFNSEVSEDDHVQWLCVCVCVVWYMGWAANHGGQNTLGGEGAGDVELVCVFKCVCPAGDREIPAVSQASMTQSVSQEKYMGNEMCTDTMRTTENSYCNTETVIHIFTFILQGMTHRPVCKYDLNVKQ